MDRCSYFLPNKALFGSHPVRNTLIVYNTVKELEENGVRYFVDLTFPEESGVCAYTTEHSYTRYPIKDMRVPGNWETFSKLVLNICTIIDSLKEGEKIYIHCKGGHGRAGVVVACVLCQYLQISPTESLELVLKYHSDRKILREKWRRIGSPQTYGQKEFVRRFFDPLFVNYIRRPFTLEKKDDNRSLMILKKWIEAQPYLKVNLLRSGLRPLIENSLDSYWGDAGDGTGRNTLGKMLTRIRNEFYRVSEK